MGAPFAAMRRITSSGKELADPVPLEVERDGGPRPGPVAERLDSDGRARPERPVDASGGPGLRWADLGDLLGGRPLDTADPAGGGGGGGGGGGEPRAHAGRAISKLETIGAIFSPFVTRSGATATSRRGGSHGPGVPRPTTAKATRHHTYRPTPAAMTAAAGQATGLGDAPPRFRITLISDDPFGDGPAVGPAPAAGGAGAASRWSPGSRSCGRAR